MGGFGSGMNSRLGIPRKRVAESSWILDANRWMKQGILREDSNESGIGAWKCRDGSVLKILVVADLRNPQTAYVFVSYAATTTETEDVFEGSLIVFVTRTRPHLGGLRWWFTCPLIRAGVPCQRRVSKLYLPPGARLFGCRDCHNLTYISCQESGKYRHAARMLALSVGIDPKECQEIIRGLKNRYSEAR